MAMAASSLGTLLPASRSSINGSSLSLPLRLPSPSPKSLPFACRAEKSDQENLSMSTTAGISRRFALSFLAGAATVLSSRVSPAEAAYGEAANIFAAPKKDSGFVAVAGDGFKLEVPSKWNPSKEVEFPGTVLRYEDNFDTNSNVCVMVTATNKKSIKDYGPPEKFIEDVAYLLGKQTYAGKTQSEGGFAPDAVAAASILDSSTSNLNGKEYYNISMLTRTADGNEGGKHQVVVATVNDGKLYMLKAQAGDKRWFKGAKKFVEGTASSFSLA